MMSAACAKYLSAVPGLVCFAGRLPRWVKAVPPLAHRVRRLTRRAVGCFLFGTRDAFEAVGGFDGTLYAAEEVYLSRALKRRGRFMMLREPVVTSGRKIRTHSAAETFGTLFRLVLGGRPCLRDRRGMDVWYGERRADPDG